MHFETELKSAIQFYSQTADETLINDIVSSIAHCPSSPYHVLTFENSGCYKEVYSDIPGVVLKFCSTENQTREEELILNFAEVYGLKDLFVPTSFIPLPSPLPLVCLQDDENEYTEADYIEVQPIVEPYFTIHSEVEFTCINGNNLNSYTTIFGQPIPNRVIYHFPSKNLTWITDFISCYGYNKFFNLANFCERYHIYDLHNDNIGYYNDKPIILDWLSDFHD